MTKLLRFHPLTLAIVLTLPALAHAQASNTSPVSGSDGTTTNPKDGAASVTTKTLQTIDVVGKLDVSRNRLSPETGSSEYVFDRSAIGQLPLGDNTPLNQLLLHAPGVVEDSFGALHVRGDHADLQYRINGVIIPESISGFGQTLDTRFASKVKLLTGALPAQYGYRTAGVVDITTKSGAVANGGSIGLYGGSFGTLNPSAEFYGSADKFSYYVTGNFLESDLGIENPTASRNAIHDHTDQGKAFGYFSYLISDSMRASLILGVSNGRFQIPNNPDQDPAFQLTGVDTFDSANLNERQREVTRYGVFSLQGQFGASSDYQVSLSQRYTSVNFHPDPIGDLIFNGVAAQVFRGNRSVGIQADFSTPLNDTNTLRYGVVASRESAVSNNSSAVFPADDDGNQTSTDPITIVDNTRKIGHLYGAYIQDQWQATEKFTVNYGLRADHVNAFIKEGQLSPRVGAVYQLSDDTTLHAGYARYFTPPPTELIAPTDIALFQNTTNALPTNANTDIRSERSHYFDVGISHQLSPALTVGLDAYYRKVRNLLDEGQFGQALVFSPFNYDRARVYGLEFTSSYATDALSAYLNITTGKAEATKVVTGQFNFEQDELDYIATHYVHVDHDQKLTASAGVSYLWGNTRFGADALFGSGLRRGFANSDHVPAYAVVNLSATHDFDLPGFGKLGTRIAVLNVFDKVYELRDGSGIGVGAPQFGARRGLYVGLTKEF